MLDGPIHVNIISRNHGIFDLPEDMALELFRSPRHLNGEAPQIEAGQKKSLLNSTDALHSLALPLAAFQNYPPTSICKEARWGQSVFVVSVQYTHHAKERIGFHFGAEVSGPI